MCRVRTLKDERAPPPLENRESKLRRRPLTDEQVAAAAEMYASGLSIATIAAQLDTSYNNVRQRLIKAGVRLRPRGGSHEGRYRASSE